MTPSSLTRTALWHNASDSRTVGAWLIRPDGYIGAIAALDDTTTIAEYFAKIRS